MASCSIPPRKLRRGRSSLKIFAAALVLAAASVASAAETPALRQGSSTEEKLGPAAIQDADRHASDSTVDSIVDDKGSQSEVLHEEERELRENRRLQAAAASAFKFWTPEKMAAAVPYELVLDPSDGAAYQMGATGFLKPYGMAADIAAEGVRFENAVVMSVASISFSEAEVDDGPDDEHSQAERLGISHPQNRMLRAGEQKATEELEEEEEEDYPKNALRHRRRTKRNKNNKTKKQKPKVKFTFPKKNASVGKEAIFGAKVKDTKSVKIELTKPNGQKSNWLNVPHVGNNVYEVKVEDLDEHPGTWKYRIQAENNSGNRKRTAKKKVTVDLGGGGNDDIFKAPPAPSPSGNSPPTSGSPPTANKLPQNSVGEAKWPYNGDVQTSTGRIIFEFPDTALFWCSGTVVKSDTTRRSIVLTAAHCIYNDVLQKFSRNAVFIPDQGSTTGGASDFNFDNDPYGGYYLDFGVVEKGWPRDTFPFNVEYDYGYYVVKDAPNTHSGGFKSGLSGVLHKDVVPLRIDFDNDPIGEFTAALGFSANKDPSFRYCAKTTGTVTAIAGYTNYFLDNCGLTGGSSGGPWSIDMDKSGMGTVISVNSWGFVDSPSMAGPSLRTRDGSHAKCLFDRSKSAADPGSSNGIIENC